MNCKRIIAVMLGGLVWVSLPEIQATTPPAVDSVKLIAPAGYLPGLPTLVRVEVHNARAVRDWTLWDGEATLTADQPGVTLSTNRVSMRNGMGSALVAFQGGGDFNLTASVGAKQATRALVSLTNLPVTTVGGTNTSSNTVWSGVIRVTNDVTVPEGYTLTILSNTLVLLDGVNSGTAANDLRISGRVNCFGTEEQPVTITCGSSNTASRWGQFRFEGSSLATAALNTFQYTIITRGGRATGEGHTGQAPVLRANRAKIRMEHCSITDHALPTRGVTGFGTPGKIGYALNSELTFDDCLFQRARMGPEVEGTALLFTNGVIMDMRGPDDADGIYIHAQGAGQSCALKDSVVAAGDDDGIDTLDSTVTVEGCILRDWSNTLEDAKAISAFNRTTTVRRSLIVDNTVGIAAKTVSNNFVRVNLFDSTLTRNGTNVLAQNKNAQSAPVIDYRITNSILWGVTDSVQSDYDTTNFTIGYCNLSEPWPGTGNLMADPLFADATAHDFRLLPYSPSIDTGNPSSAPDPDGSPADQGWIPFLPPGPVLSGAERLAGGFEFVLGAYSNRNYVIETSATATEWAFLKSVWAQSEMTRVTDAGATNANARFYRARLAP